MAGTSTYDVALSQLVAIIDEHRKNCERLQKYADADMARQRLMELKEHQVFRRIEALRSRQLAELLGLEEAHMLEFQEFNMGWDMRVREFEEQATMTLLQLKLRHADQLTEYQQSLLIRSSNPRHSKDYFELRKIEETLAKHKK